jgi:hypothetical protein
MFEMYNFDIINLLQFSTHPIKHLYRLLDSFVSYEHVTTLQHLPPLLTILKFFSSLSGVDLCPEI